MTLGRRGFLMSCVAGAAAAVSAEPRGGAGDASFADVPALLDRELQAWNVPGVALAVVVDGELRLLLARGLRNVAHALPMTPQTVQPIASVTKIATAATLSMLVHEGALQWDRPVRETMPAFRLRSEYATQTVTLRDMLSHRTGLGRHDFAWFNSGASRDELLDRVRHFEMASELRTAWQYNNWMVLVAGVLAGRAAGGTWETLVERRLFEPLAMRRATLCLPSHEDASGWATGYRLDTSKTPRPVPFMNLQAMGPCGSINASATDMAQLLRLLVGLGTIDGVQRLDEQVLRPLVTPQIAVPSPTRFAEIGETHHGLGLFLTQYRGERLAWHGGNLPGVTTLMSFMPARRIGIYVATNQSSSVLPAVLAYTLYDRLLGAPALDWSERYRGVVELGEARAQATARKSAQARKAGTTPTHAASELAGEYMHPGYGRFSVAAESDALRGRFNGLSSLFMHHHYNVFEAPADPLNDFSGLKLQFHLDLEGEIAHFTAKLDTTMPPIVFERLRGKGAEATTP
jgi:CubicO group peptidase (beta-lactamase class C family)